MTMRMQNNSTKQMPPAALILVAAGSSTRIGSGIKKEYLQNGSGTVLSTAASVFLRTLPFCLTVVTYPFHDDAAEDEAALSCCRKALFSDPYITTAPTEILFVPGGISRQESVFKALGAVATWFKNHAINEDTRPLVFIHDGARPFVTGQCIMTVAETARLYGAAVPGLQPVDTQKEITADNTIARHLIRTRLTAVQTPQAFLFYPLFSAHKKAAEEDAACTDDTEIWDRYPDIPGRGKVHVVPGDPVNRKITYPEDLMLITPMEHPSMIHTGLGYDKHVLVEGRRLVLGGICIPFEKGESGHSDGDVLLHAITDALLGAAGLGDIGSYFPPSDMKWKDADSAQLLTIVWKDINTAGWKLGNLDCVIALEQPKFLPYREKVCLRIAEILNCSPDQVFVKAKTGEKLGDVGQGRAIEAWAACLLEK